MSNLATQFDLECVEGPDLGQTSFYKHTEPTTALQVARYYEIVRNGRWEATARAMQNAGDPS